MLSAPRAPCRHDAAPLCRSSLTPPATPPPCADADPNMLIVLVGFSLILSAALLAVTGVRLPQWVSRRVRCRNLAPCFFVGFWQKQK